MTRRSSSFVLDRELIIVEAEVVGPIRTAEARLVLDTGAAATTLTPKAIQKIGYSTQGASQAGRDRAPSHVYVLPHVPRDARRHAGPGHLRAGARAVRSDSGQRIRHRWRRRTHLLAHQSCTPMWMRRSDE